jgi:pimeloyl-ACP methyl ester carboxylesterase
MEKQQMTGIRMGTPIIPTGRNTPIVIMSLLMLFASIVTLVSPLQARTVTDKEIEGIWQGVLEHSGMELLVAFTISLNPDHTLTATMDVPEQDAIGIPVDKVVFDGSTLRLEIIPIEGVFEGEFAEDSRLIRGQWTQGDAVITLVLESTDTKPVIKRPQEPREPFPYKVEDVVFHNTEADITLAGTLTLPPSDGTFSAVLLLSGSGPQDRDESVFGHRPFLLLADHLTQRGIAVLRVDDRGVGGSTGDFSKTTAPDFAADAIAGITYLRGRKEINHELIGMIGHSEGGMIAPMVAVQIPEIAYIVLIASPGLPIREMEFLGEENDLRAKGASDDLVAKIRATSERLFEVIAHTSDSATVLRDFGTIISDSFEDLSEEERKIAEISRESLDEYIQDRVQRLHSPWFRFYLPYDPGTVLQRITCPTLALNGEKDVQVPPEENLRAIGKALKTGGNKDYTVRQLPELNHLLQTAETGSISEYRKIEETMSPLALKVISDWILERTEP